MGAVDTLELHAKALEDTARIVEGVRPDRMDAPSPCDEWGVRHLLGHLTAGNLRWAKRAAGEAVQFGGSDEPIDDVTRYRETATAVKDAWRQPGRLKETFKGPLGEAPGEMLVRQHITETVTHGWDVARATDQQPNFDPEVVAAALDFARTNMPPERPAAFGPPNEPPQGASEVDRLAAFMGRRV